MSRVVVTGGAGFIGSHLVDRLCDAGHEVVVIDNLDPAAHDGPPEWLHADAEYLVADVRDPEVWAARAARAPTRCRTRRRRSAWVSTCPTSAATSTPTTSARRRCCSPCTAPAGGAVWWSPPAWWSTARVGTAAPTTAWSHRHPGASRTWRPGGSSRAARAAARPSSPVWCPRTRPSTPATSTPRRSCTRSTCAGRTRVSTTWRCARCATTTSTDRGCRGTPPTREWRRSSAASWQPVRRRGCTRTAASCATSCTSPTSRVPTSSRCSASARTTVRSTSRPARR